MARLPSYILCLLCHGDHSSSFLRAGCSLVAQIGIPTTVQPMPAALGLTKIRSPLASGMPPRLAAGRNGFDPRLGARRKRRPRPRRLKRRKTDAIRKFITMRVGLAPARRLRQKFAVELAATTAAVAAAVSASLIGRSPKRPAMHCLRPGRCRD